MSVRRPRSGELERRLLTLLAVAAAGASSAAAPLARAQELGVTAEVEAPMAATGGDDPSASATEVDARDRPSALDTLEDALVEVPGARPLRTGAYGSATTLSLRGSDADQVTVLFGEIPVTTADGGGFDLSTVPLWALDRVEVYRGGAPAWLGAGGMGGVVRLVPRQARRTRGFGTLGVGSFGLVHGRAGASVSDGDTSWLTTVGVTSSEGDFPYLDDQRTALDPADDVERSRSNGWLREGSGLGHLRVPLGDGALSALLLGLERTGGVPGPASQPTHQTRRHETHLLGSIGWEGTEGGRRAEEAGWRAAFAISGAYRRRRLTDRLAEIGLVPRITDDHASRVVARAAFCGRAAEWLELSGVGLYTHESLRPEDALARRPVGSSARDGGTFAFEARAHGRVNSVRLELRPSARLAVVDSRLHELRAERAGQPQSSLAVAPTFRIGAALEPVRGLTIAASAASATRLPTMLELFGDRGFLVGDTRLKPERAETFDLGVALRGRAGEARGAAELRGFFTLASDLLRYRRNNQFQAVPENVGSAMLGGGELGVRGEVGPHFALRGALTLLHTHTEHLGRSRQLPLRPWMSAYVRPEGRILLEGAVERIGVWVDMMHVAQTPWDAANTSWLPARTRFGLGGSMLLLGGRLRIDVSVADVFDQRGTDLLGFPLPGRSLSVALSGNAG